MAASAARAAASRANGATSGGPRTAEGKANSARNALKHGLTAQVYVAGDEDAGELMDLMDALEEEFTPQDAWEDELVRRLATALMRLRRSDRFEAELIDDGTRHLSSGKLIARLAMPSVRDGFQSLNRYRATALSEVKALSAELRQRAAERAKAEAEAARAEEKAAEKAEAQARARASAPASAIAADETNPGAAENRRSGAARTRSAGAKKTPARKREPG